MRPAVRKIVSVAAEDHYRIQSLIIAVAQSYPFVMRRTVASREHETAETALHAHEQSSGAD